jgi:hypothetical protein
LKALFAGLALCLVSAAPPPADKVLKTSIHLKIPEEYKTGAKTVVLTVTSQAAVAKACKAPNDKLIIACGDTKKPFIWTQNPCDAEVYPEVKNHRSYAFHVCHEIAHTKGWSHD